MITGGHGAVLGYIAGLAGASGMLIVATLALESSRYQNASEALRAGLRLLEREEDEINALRNQLSSGLAQARSGEFAKGSGEEAIRRAFASARKKA